MAQQGYVRKGMTLEQLAQFTRIYSNPLKYTGEVANYLEGCEFMVKFLGTSSLFAGLALTLIQQIDRPSFARHWMINWLFIFLGLVGLFAIEKLDEPDEIID